MPTAQVDITVKVRDSQLKVDHKLTRTIEVDFLRFETYADLVDRVLNDELVRVDFRTMLELKKYLRTILILSGKSSGNLSEGVEDAHLVDEITNSGIVGISLTSYINHLQQLAKSM